MRLFSHDSFIERVRERAARKDENLLTAGRNVAKSIAYSYLLYYGILILVSIALLVVLGFTDLLGGPLVVAQIALFLLVGTLVLAVAGLLWIWHRIKRALHRLDKTDKKTTATDTAVIKRFNIDKKSHE